LDKIFSAFDERLGPVPVYSTIKDPILTKKIAVKSIVSTLTSVQTSTSEKLEGEAIIPFPNENKLAFIFYASLDQKTEGGEHRVVSLCAIVETEQKSSLYTNATTLSQEASQLKNSLNKYYIYGQELSSDLKKQFEAWGQKATKIEVEVIPEKQITFNIHSLFDLFPVEKSLRKVEDPLVPLFLGMFVKIPVILVGPNIEFLLEIADLLRGYFPNEELDVRLALSLHVKSLHHAISYGVPRADLILLNEDQYRRALFYREPIIIVRIGKDPRYDNYHPPSKAISFIEDLMKKIRSFSDETVCNLFLQGEFMTFLNKRMILRDFHMARKQDSPKKVAQKLGMKEHYLIALAESLRVQQEISHEAINRMFVGKTNFTKMDTLNPLSVGIIH
jgi:hypothetical protein